MNKRLTLSLSAVAAVATVTALSACSSSSSSTGSSSSSVSAASKLTGSPITVEVITELTSVDPAPEDVAVFHRMLIDGGIPTFTRRPRGRDIYAACGQLKRTISEGAAGPGLVGISAMGA